MILDLRFAIFDFGLSEKGQRQGNFRFAILKFRLETNGQSQSDFRTWIVDLRSGKQELEARREREFSNVF